MAVSIHHGGYVSPHWANVAAVFSIDGIPWEGRPGLLYIDNNTMWPYGGWSCIINFPTLSNRDVFRGQHTLLLRTIPQPPTGRELLIP